MPISTPTALPPRSRLKSIVLVLTVTFAMIINLANSSAISIALPAIQRELDLQEAQLQWIVSSYSLSSGCLLLVFGRVSDVYGRKKTFTFGAVFLAIFTLASAFPKNVATLAALRGLQGIGAAAMLPAGLGILAHAFTPSPARSLAFATFSAGATIGAVFGTAIGGALTEFTQKTWRSTFYLFTGLVIVILVSGLFSIDADVPSREIDKRVDWIGAFLVTAGLVLIVFALGQGENAPHQWATPYIIALLIVGVIFVGLFLFWQHYLEKRFDDHNSAYSFFMPPPLMRISLWSRANGRLAAIMVIAFTTWCGFLSWVYWTLLYYQNYKQYSPMQTVVRFVPMFVCGILCNIFVGFVAAIVPLGWLVGVGSFATSMAILLFTLSKRSTIYWAFEFPAIWLSVLGADFVFSAGSLFIAKFALPHEQSMAGALFNTMIQLGTTCGITVTTIVFKRVTLARPSGADMIVSYHSATWTSFAFCMLALILSVLSLRSVGVVGHRGPRTASAEKPDEETSIPDEFSNKQT